MARPSGGMLLETLLSILLKHTAGYSAGLPLYAAVTGTQPLTEIYSNLLMVSLS